MVEKGMSRSEVETPLVLARGVVKTYQRGRQPVEALRGVDLDVEPGAFVGVLGPSGGGKSTLLHILGGVDRPTSGTVRVAGVALETASEGELDRFRRDHIGFVFQFDNLLPSLSALENVVLPLTARGWRREEAREKAQAALALVGLQDRLAHKPAELSGGQQQRVAIARAVVGEPRLVLTDEPTGDLDSRTAQSVLALMRDLNRRLGVTFIIATHNEALMENASEIYDLVDGRLSLRWNDGANGAG